MQALSCAFFAKSWTFSTPNHLATIAKWNESEASFYFTHALHLVNSLTIDMLTSRRYLQVSHSHNFFNLYSSNIVGIGLKVHLPSNLILRYFELIVFRHPKHNRIQNNDGVHSLELLKVDFQSIHGKHYTLDSFYSFVFLNLCLFQCFSE